MTATLSRYDPIKGCFVLKDLTPKPPASPFEWMRFTEEEKARRGGKPLLAPNDYVRSEAVDNKKVASLSLKPRAFLVYNKAFSSKGVKK